ncbi:regulator of G-protein signaling 12-like [Ptychodera flava]|uniref:regulator of G-protein signaling 12-like n=1 Tax=Ptychodera flava TaxID=63121 RepID=UPI00396A0E03
MIHRPLSPLEVSSILYPSLQPHVSAAIPLDIEHELDEDDLYLSVVVGYLGSIEIPAEANLQTASLQAIRGCVRRLRIEQRIHTLVFDGDHHQGYPEICAHNVHAKKAAKFGIQCAVDPETNGCREFPRSAKPILRTLAKLYQDRHNGLYVNELQRAQVYMSGEYPLDARRSNSNSSNSDSGIGYCRDSEGMNGSGSGDRIVVDNPKNMHGSYDGQGTPTPNRLLVKADVMHNSFDVPYPSSMKQHLSAEALHKNVTSVDMASRLSPRVRTHPQELDRPVSRLSMNVYSDSVDSNDAQESLNRAQHVSENEYSDEPKTMARAPTGLPPTGIHRHSMYAKVDNTGSKKDAAERETQGVSARRISDGRILLKNQDLRNGSGKALMHRGMKNKKSPGLVKSLSKESLTTSDGDRVENPFDTFDSKSLVWVTGMRSYLRFTSQRVLYRGKCKKMGLQEKYTPILAYCENLHLQMIPVSRSSSLRSVDSVKDVQKEETGRVASWAVSFERLLSDPLGLLYFTEFLKKEFSEENIAFWMRQKTARDMYNKHLGKKASMPVNLDSHAKQEVEIRLENPTPDMFDFQQKQSSLKRVLEMCAPPQCLTVDLSTPAHG